MASRMEGETVAPRPRAHSRASCEFSIILASDSEESVNFCAAARIMADSTWIWVGASVGVIVALIIILFLLHKYFQGGKFRKDDVLMDGKVVIITGANTGIGKETALDLARRGAKVYMACRDKGRGEEARLEVIEKSGNPHVLFRPLDLASLASVRTFVENFKNEEARLDVLINNAGVMMIPNKNLTEDGFEMQIGVNHMAHFLLTNLLLDLLKKSAPSRIVTVSSLAHMSGQINKEDLNSDKSYNRITAYAQSKLANILFTRELARRLESTRVTANCLHPGAVNTELLRHIPTFLVFIGRPFLMLFFKTPRNGAQTQIRLAVDPVLEDVTGKYFSDCKEVKPRPQAQDDEMAAWLWAESVKWTKLSPAEAQ
ncbi:retinol dehydrogenase 14-like [Phlebotomus argentipes]|uniref:retinol dehydrogenase 14-like n=1 Tax=Phlebotomus argentipes TaxID=94469 RepID=UPI0028930D8C|nr:retinol dehydrogenase 14-like [Phlebotomus argentipes]